MRKATSTFAMIFSFAAAACSTSDPPLTVDTFNAAYAVAWCAALDNCARGFFWFGATDACNAYYRDDPTYPADAGKVHAGRIAFNVDKATSCLHLLRSTKCVLLQPQSSDCRDMLTGAVATGKGCESDDVCASGWCKGATTVWAGSHPACGVCADALKIGETCVGHCAFGSTCIGQVCTASGSVGVGGACKDSSDCVAPAFCPFSGPGGSSTCKARSAIGESCEIYGCNPGAVCLPASYVEAYTGDGTCGPPRNSGDECLRMSAIGNDNGDCGDGRLANGTARSPPRCAASRES